MRQTPTSYTLDLTCISFYYEYIITKSTKQNILAYSKTLPWVTKHSTFRTFWANLPVFWGGIKPFETKKEPFRKMKTDKFKFVLIVHWMNEWPSTSSIAENFRKYSRKYDKKKLNVSQLVVNFKMWISNKESIFSTKVYQCDCKLLPHLETPVARTLKTRAS